LELLAGFDPSWARWLLAHRTIPKGADEPAELAYYVCAGPAETTLEQLIAVAGDRWRMEYDYRECKTALDLDHFEGRTWSGWHRHVTLVTAAQLFLTLLQTSPKAAAPA